MASDSLHFIIDNQTKTVLTFAFVFHSERIPVLVQKNEPAVSRETTGCDSW